MESYLYDIIYLTSPRCSVFSYIIISNDSAVSLVLSFI